MKKSGTSLRVLVIDDDEDLSAIIVDALREQGITAWSIRPVPSSPVESVVTTAVWFRPHVVLIDVVMPVNTARLVEALRAEPALEGSTLLGCSGHAALAGSFAGMLDGFIHKPFSLRELGEMLADAVGISASGRASTPPRGASKGKAKASTRNASKRGARGSSTSTRGRARNDRPRR